MFFKVEFEGNILPNFILNFSFRTFISPMITKPGKLFSNFWGKVGTDGYYERSPDYIDIVKYIRRGVWNVPFISNIYLIQSKTLSKFTSNPFNADERDQDMNFCSSARRLVIVMAFL